MRSRPTTRSDLNLKSAMFLSRCHLNPFGARGELTGVPGGRARLFNPTQTERLRFEFGGGLDKGSRNCGRWESKQRLKFDVRCVSNKRSAARTLSVHDTGKQRLKFDVRWVSNRRSTERTLFCA